MEEHDGRTRWKNTMEQQHFETLRWNTYRGSRQAAAAVARATRWGADTGRAIVVGLGLGVAVEERYPRVGATGGGGGGGGGAFVQLHQK